MEPLILAIDLGTTSVKQAVINANGEICVSATREYVLATPKATYVECAVETYWSAIKEGLAECLSRCPEAREGIVSIGMSVQGETLLFLDEQGIPLRDAIVWMDHRATHEAEQLTRQFGDETCYEVTGQVRFDPCWPAAKILWTSHHEPHIFRRTHTFALLEDWLIHHLTGRMVSEGSLLCSTAYWNIRTKKWWPEMLHFLGITQSQLPQILEPGQEVATLRPEIAKELGLSPNVLVCTGALDQAAGAIGVGNIRQGCFSENIGAALAICAPVDKPLFDPNRIMPLHYFAIPDMYMLHTFTTGGMAIKWFRDQFCEMEMDVAKASGLSAYELIDKEAERVAPGCDGLVALPHLGGAMAPDLDPKARGVFFGFTLKHGRGHFARAIMESIGYIIRRNLAALSDIGLKADEIRALGGGSKSMLWNQIKSDITQIPLVTTNVQEAACLGAAILAGSATGLFTSVEDACARMIHPDHKFVPTEENAEVYDTEYAIYQQMFGALKDVFATAYQEE